MLKYGWFDFGVREYFYFLITRYGKYVDRPPRWFVLKFYGGVERVYKTYFFASIHAIIYFSLVFGILAILVLIFKSEMNQAERKGEHRVSEQWRRAKR